MQFIRNTQMNNIMKRIITVILALFVIVAINAQSATVISNAPQLAAITLNGTGSTGTITFPTVQGEFDLSLQFIPALAGAGDSLHFSYVLYQSNSDATAVWTSLGSTYTVSTTTDTDALIAVTDFKGLRIKAICTKIGSDTSTVTPYWTYKKHADE